MIKPQHSRTAWTATLFVCTTLLAVPGLCADDAKIDQACQALVKYQYGQDLAPLLTLDQWVIESMATDQQRHACAARLAQLLTLPETSAAAKQYICLQLRQVGTAAEVPTLKQLLHEPSTSDIARQALQAIAGPEASQVLREALSQLKGEALLGVIHSVAARQDTEAVAQLKRFAQSPDKQVAAAATMALGHLSGPEVAAFLLQQATAAGQPTPHELAVALLRGAAQLESGAEPAEARTIYELLSQTQQTAAVRRAALEGLLRWDKQATTTVLAWLTDPDAQRQRVAAGHVQKISDQELDQLMLQLAELPEASQATVLQLAASRKGRAVLPAVLELLKSDSPTLQVAAIRCLGQIGDVTMIPTLLDHLSAADAQSKAAQDALAALPRKEVNAALIDALKTRPQDRTAVIDVLVTLKSYEAIDPLIEIATDGQETNYGPALAGLRAIADPDKHDIPRLVQLLLRTEPGRHRDEVEKTILVVTDKLPADQDHTALVLQSLREVDALQTPKYLPLLGRLGGTAARQAIEAALQSTDAATHESAIRALCNWPDAEVSGRLWHLATQEDNAQYRRWALRAYIRVTTLDADKDPAAALTALQRAMQQAQRAEDRILVIQRAAAVRTLETVQWVAPYLDDSELQQAACGTIVELAHHRFLRVPNKSVFDPLLQKVSQLAKDPDIANRARQYRL